LGQAEKTDYDAPFELLLDRAEKTKKWTEMILKQTETVLTPNPSRLFYYGFACSVDIGFCYFYYLLLLFCM